MTASKQIETVTVMKLSPKGGDESFMMNFPESFGKRDFKWSPSQRERYGYSLDELPNFVKDEMCFLEVDGKAFDCYASRWGEIELQPTKGRDIPCRVYHVNLSVDKIEELWVTGINKSKEPKL